MHACRWAQHWAQLHENRFVYFDSTAEQPHGVVCLDHYYVYCPDSDERTREYEIALLPRPFDGQARTASYIYYIDNPACAHSLCR